ncbi:MAG: hypothetical protein MZV70_07225 [Desulfobacterales bacterium]|nr:hypothetical protein [Desulfobacterales bacterium]
MEQQALGPLVEEALNLMRSLLPAGVRLNTRMPVTGPMVRADSTQIQQVVMNLCTNAWQAMRGRGGEITVSLKTCDVAQEEACQRVGARRRGATRACVRPTAVRGSLPSICTAFSSPSTPPSLPARAPSWGCRSCTALSRRTRGPLTCTASRGRNPVRSVFSGGRRDRCTSTGGDHGRAGQSPSRHPCEPAHRLCGRLRGDAVPGLPHAGQAGLSGDHLPVGGAGAGLAGGQRGPGGPAGHRPEHARPQRHRCGSARWRGSAPACRAYVGLCERRTARTGPVVRCARSACQAGPGR